MKKVAVSIHAIEDFSLDIIKGLEDLDYIHVDVMDGKFVNNTQANLDVFKTLKNSSTIPIIAHLMVKDPLDYVKKIIDYIDIFLFHFESGGDQESIIRTIRDSNKRVGMAINPDTPLTKIIPFLNKVDLVLVMTVQPGWSGQEFIWEMLDKINLLFAYRIQNNLKFEIDVDGGVNLDNAKLIHSDIITSASTILKADDPNSVIKMLKTST